MGPSSGKAPRSATVSGKTGNKNSPGIGARTKHSGPDRSAGKHGSRGVAKKGYGVETR